MDLLWLWWLNVLYKISQCAFCTFPVKHCSVAVMQEAFEQLDRFSADDWTGVGLQQELQISAINTQWVFITAIVWLVNAVVINSPLLKHVQLYFHKAAYVTRLSWTQTTPKWSVLLLLSRPHSTKMDIFQRKHLSSIISGHNKNDLRWHWNREIQTAFNKKKFFLW